MNTNAKYTVWAAGSTDIGKRTTNEDYFLIDDENMLYIVADGMGGCEKGEVASWFSSERLEQSIDEFSESDTVEDISLFPVDVDKSDADSHLQYAILSINKRLYEANQKARDEALADSGGINDEFARQMAMRKSMGTTLASLLIKGDRAYITHVGDSRVYRIANGEIEQMTQDHSWVAERVRSGELTPEEAKTHPKRNIITRSLGIKENVQADIATVELRPPERFLLCSDGLSNMLRKGELLEFGQMEDIQVASERIVEAARDLGGRDNITALIVDIQHSATLADWTDF